MKQIEKKTNGTLKWFENEIFSIFLFDPFCNVLVSFEFREAAAERTSYSQPALVKRADGLWGFLAQR